MAFKTFLVLNLLCAVFLISTRMTAARKMFPTSNLEATFDDDIQRVPNSLEGAKFGWWRFHYEVLEAGKGVQYCCYNLGPFGSYYCVRCYREGSNDNIATIGMTKPLN